MLNSWYLKFFKYKKKISNKNFFVYSYENLMLNPEETLKNLILFILDKKKVDRYTKNFIKLHKKNIKFKGLKFNQLNLKDRTNLKKSLNTTINKIEKNFGKNIYGKLNNF